MALWYRKKANLIRVDAQYVGKPMGDEAKSRVVRATMEAMRSEIDRGELRPSEFGIDIDAWVRDLDGRDSPPGGREL